MFTTLRLDRRGAVATLTLSRPEVHNAFNEHMIADLTAACQALADDNSVRVVVLAADGKSFSAGADIDWMQRMAASSQDENRADAARMAEMLHAINELPKPVVARVQGAALGGGAGLLACADVVVAVRAARIGMTEVKVGLLPSVIGPFVLRKIGGSWARAHFLLGDRFDAATAREMGLVHEIVDDVAALDARVEAIVGEMLEGSPAAQAEAKHLLRALAADPDPARQRALTAETISRVRASDEGREGLRAFMEKRKPSWAHA
ncbi:MAG: enoyl-CoA hydratase/isomerase family protein [Armatimonadetes bacterium]|nr:enoyl-CoA hydratase/isomerase family protein [Armatimonadota bacterium]